MLGNGRFLVKFLQGAAYVLFRLSRDFSRREVTVTLREVKEILDAYVYVGYEQLDMEVTAAFSADLMSDVLAHAKTKSLLLTGITNPQAVRTASILDIAAIILVRDKQPPPETIALAEELGIPMLSTKYILFETSGRLYVNGIVGCIQKVVRDTST